MGKKWRSGRSYSEIDMKYHGANTCYSNKGTMGQKKEYSSLVKIYSFDEVDISKYDTKKNITIDEFFEGEEKAIHCDKEWKAKLLCEVFHKMGKIWRGGESYSDETHFSYSGSETCYSNDCCFCNKSYYVSRNIPIYEFEQLDLSKYLTKEEEIIK